MVANDTLYDFRFGHQQCSYWYWLGKLINDDDLKEKYKDNPWYDLFAYLEKGIPSWLIPPFGKLGYQSLFYKITEDQKREVLSKSNVLLKEMVEQRHQGFKELAIDLHQKGKAGLAPFIALLIRMKDIKTGWSNFIELKEEISIEKDGLVWLLEQYLTRLNPDVYIMLSSGERRLCGIDIRCADPCSAFAS
ncbi:MAG: hypothetical protein GY793_08740 [Proteobacteria bacterium]|nr:hypothetical protein [Pseudomonadota bacterium]